METEKYPKVLPGAAIRDIGATRLSNNWGRVETAPAGATNTIAEAYHAPLRIRTEDEVCTILAIPDGLSEVERRDFLTGLLDQHFRHYEWTRATRVPLMQLARANGLSCHEIAVILGITAGAVHQALKRAGDASDK